MSVDTQVKKCPSSGHPRKNSLPGENSGSLLPKLKKNLDYQLQPNKSKVTIETFFFSKQSPEMKQHETDIDFELAREKEQELKHDVMAHIHTFGAVCPSAKPIIHLGATSAFVGDNTDIICMKESMQLVQKRLLKLMSLLRDFAKKYKDLPTLGYTHFQPAQLTT